MPTIKMSFPGGRYHATPWGHHVNEGQIEWPPGPWRLLRALIAVGYTTQHWQEVPPTGRKLIEQLANVHPEYILPSSSSAHTRHYMPVGKLKANKLEDTTLVFDTWANIGDDALVIHWPCDLDDDCIILFAQLVDNLNYLGRSESWVDAQVIDRPLDLNQPSESTATTQHRSFPHRDNEYPGPEWEQFHLMAATSPSAYAQWRERQIKPLLDVHPLPDNKKPQKSLLNKREKAIAPYPDDLIECLQKDTSWWKTKHKWSQPPGAQRVLYWRRTDALVVSHPSRPHRPAPHPVEVALLAISTPSRNASALPSVVRTLPQAELFHQAIVGRAGKGSRVHCPELTGLDQSGKPLQGKHNHAHVLPLDLDRDLHIDHLLIWAPVGLGGVAQEAIRSTRRTWTKGGIGELQVALVGRGSLTSLRSLPAPLNKGVRALLGPELGSTEWVSETPYVPPRFFKRRGRHTLEGQVREELQSRYGVTLIALEVIQPVQPDNTDTSLLDLARRHRHFIRKRKPGKPQPPVSAGYTLRISIEQPLNGPVCLGYGSHYGLGLFSSVLINQTESDHSHASIECNDGK